MAHPFGVAPGILGRLRKRQGILFEQTSGLDRFGLPSP